MRVNCCAAVFRNCLAAIKIKRTAWNKLVRRTLRFMHLTHFLSSHFLLCAIAGLAFCGRPRFMHYGMLSIAWAGRAAARRLSQAKNQRWFYKILREL